MFSTTIQLANTVLVYVKATGNKWTFPTVFKHRKQNKMIYLSENVSPLVVVKLWVVKMESQLWLKVKNCLWLTLLVFILSWWWVQICSIRAMIINGSQSGIRTNLVSIALFWNKERIYPMFYHSETSTTNKNHWIGMRSRNLKHIVAQLILMSCFNTIIRFKY